jgi:hypothetical protein
MVKARASALPIALLALLVQAGCAPARHTVRVQAPDGQARTTTPPPRPPLALPREDVRQTVRALAREVVPVADPVAFARERFGVPVLEGVYLFDGRTKELKPADKATEAEEESPPELVEQTRKYLRYCDARHMPGDCFGALHGRRTLDAHGRYTVAMGIALAGTFEATGESLKDMLSVKEVLSMVVAGVTMYAVLWVLPEPTSKGIAAAMTIVMVGYVGVHTLYTLGSGFVDLIENSEKATTFEALHDEGERFAGVMGADTARVLVMVATAAVGSGLSQFLKVLPKLPGAPQASELAVAESGVSFEQVGAVEGVTIGRGGLTISLVSGAVLTTSLMTGSGRPTPAHEPKASPAESRSAEPRAENAADAVRLRKQLASEAGAAELKAGGGKAIAGAGTRSVITDLPRLLAEHGGRPEDWAKVTSRVYSVGDGTTVQVHAYRNVRTGQLVELKSIVE